MPVRHPQADRDAAPAAVTVGTTTYPVASDGRIDCPSGAEGHVADVLAAAYGCEAPALLVGDVCDEIQSDDTVCGRSLPCPYHSDDENED